MHVGEFIGPARVSGSMVTATTASLVLIPANNSRRSFAIYNHSNQPLFVKLGETSSTTDFSFKLDSGSFYEMSQPIHTGSVAGVWGADDDDGKAAITEFSVVSF